MAANSHDSVVDYLERLFDSGTVHGQTEGRLLERFIASADAAAPALVVRHGPMVLGVCRRLLSDPNDVDDAYQATFLILVTRARSIRDRDVLASWLHGVARRVAVRARTMTRKRQRRELSMAEDTTVDDRPADPVEAAEVLVNPRCRARASAGGLSVCRHPLRSRRVAAREGGPVPWLPGGNGQEPPRSRPRDAALEARSGRRDLCFSRICAASSAALTNTAVPTRLLRLTVRAATELAASGTVTAGVCSAGAACKLAKGVSRSMTANFPKLAAFGLLAVGLGAAAASTLVGPVVPNPGIVPAAAGAAQDPGPDAAVKAAAADEKTGSLKRNHTGSSSTTA